MQRVVRFVVLIGMVTTAGCGGQADSPEAADDATMPVAGLPAIDASRMLADITTLASDEFEGRLPGTDGEQRTVRYLTDQFAAAGLSPGNPDGTWTQAVPLVGITGRPSDLRVAPVSGGSGPARTLAQGEDVVAWTRRVTDHVRLDPSELVFVGYGVEAPEFDWDDYKGIDTAGKTLVMLVNDPPVAGGDGQLDPTIFGGRAMTYYGRWTYKYDKGAEKGAAAVLIVHETGPAGYGWNVIQGFGGERFDLETPDRNMGFAAMEGWLHVDRARELFAAAGHDFDALKQAAASRDFRPVSLGMTAAMTIDNTVRRIQSQNVVARLAGSDPARADQHVVFTAHWDHLGVGTPVEGDAIYNGAVDNATGVAALLEIARAFAAMRPAPARSILFLAVTAEEAGLLGSAYYAADPLYPLAGTAANINIDAMNVHGRTSDVVLIGRGASELDDYAEVAAAEQGRTIVADPEPEKGSYYRSDHFNFAKVGVPALYAASGIEYRDRPAGWGRARRDEYTQQRYHQPQDEVRPEWDLSGAAEDSAFYLAIGYRIANASRAPEWREGSEFKAIRDRSLGRR